MKLRWYQYSLRTLMLLVLLIAIGMSWFTVKLSQARQQREIVKQLKTPGLGVYYDYEVNEGGMRKDIDEIPFVPVWLINLLGKDFFTNVVAVETIDVNNANDTTLEHIKELSHLHYLNISAARRITDVGLKHLEGMTQLKSLAISGDEITDTGLVHIKNLYQLESLSIWGKQITDAGLVHLQGLTKLHFLNIGNSKITVKGLVYLKALPQLNEMRLDGESFTDAELEHIKELPQLKKLQICSAQITDNGLIYLKELTNLQELVLWCGQYSDAEIVKLRKALPNTKIDFTSIR
jgi:hypothetical protein